MPSSQSMSEMQEVKSVESMAERLSSEVALSETRKAEMQEGEQMMMFGEKKKRARRTIHKEPKETPKDIDGVLNEKKQRRSKRKPAPLVCKVLEMSSIPERNDLR